VKGLGRRLGFWIWAGAFFLPVTFRCFLGFGCWSSLCVPPFPFWIGAFSLIMRLLFYLVLLSVTQEQQEEVTNC
jgi:hypothetical protein